MLIDGRTMPDGETLEAQLCVVGCGPGGITVAQELAGPGMSVLVIESGGPKRDRRQDRSGAGESVGAPYPPLSSARARGIGGTSLHWEMHQSGGDQGWISRPLDPLDFSARPRIPGSGWPFGGEELAECYRRAQMVAGLGRWGYEPCDWPADAAAPFDLPADRVVSHVFQRGTTRFSRYLADLEAAPHIRVVHHATVLDVEQSEQGPEVSRLRVATGQGRHIFVRARRYVLAAGGIENPRLLLLSRSADRPQGLGNARDLVGRHFMERLTARAGVIVPSGPALLARAAFYQSHLVEGMRIQGTLSLAPALIEREGLRNATFWVLARRRIVATSAVGSLVTLARSMRRRPISARLMAGHAGMIARDLPAVTRAAGQLLLRTTREPEVLQLGVQAEQAPDLDSRVTLGHRLDRFGLPVARLDWKPTEADRASIASSVRLLDEALRGAGIGRIDRAFGEETPEAMFIGNSHHMGTTRMSTDPARGVVDPSGRVHGVPNLYVAGSSVFPTSGYANPTLTIVALAIRLAGELRSQPWGDVVE